MHHVVESTEIHCRWRTGLPASVCHFISSVYSAVCDNNNRTSICKTP